MKKPETLEEANQIIADLQAKVDKVIDEKKEVLKMFDEKALEGMTETERTLATALETERVERAKLAKQIEEDNKKRELETKERLTKQLDERITKVAKGDKDFEAKLRANVDLLDKLPRTTDADLDAVVESAYKLTGQKEPNPLNNGGHSSNNPAINSEQGFGTTQAGQGLASKLNLTVTPPKAEGDGGAK